MPVDLGQALRDDLEAVHQADAAHDQDKDKGQRPQVGSQTQGHQGGEEPGDQEKAPVAAVKHGLHRIVELGGLVGKMVEQMHGVDVEKRHEKIGELGLHLLQQG